MKSEKKPKTGPKPDTLKLDEDWRNAMGKALKKKRPEEGWPEPEKEEKQEKDEK